LFFSNLLFSYPKGYVYDSCEGPLASVVSNGKTPEERLLQEHIRVNSQFPQMNEGIDLALVTLYLTEPVDTEAFIATPSSAEIEKLGKAMDKMHKFCGVGYRTVGHGDLKGDTAHLFVKPARLSGLIQSFNTRAIRKTYGLGEVIQKFRVGEEKHAEWAARVKSKATQKGVPSNAGSFFVQELMLSPASTQVTSDLNRVSQVFKAYLNSPEYALMAKDYQQVMRTYPKNMGFDHDKRDKERSRVRKVMLRQLRPKLLAVAPDLEPAINEIMGTMLE
jgi:hypothetical protein